MKLVNPIYGFTLHHFTYLIATSAVHISPTDLVLDFDNNVEARPLAFNLVHPVSLHFTSISRGEGGTVRADWVPDVLSATLSRGYNKGAEPFDTVNDHFHQSLNVFYEYPGVDRGIEILVKAHQDTLMSELNATLCFGLVERDRSGGLPPLPGGSRKARSWAMTPFYHLKAVGQSSVRPSPKIDLVIRCRQKGNSARMQGSDPDARRVASELEKAMAAPQNDSVANARNNSVRRSGAVNSTDSTLTEPVGMQSPVNGPPRMSGTDRSSSTAHGLPRRASPKERYIPRSMMLTSRSHGAILTVTSAWTEDFVQKSMEPWKNGPRLGENVGSYYPDGLHMAQNYTDGPSYVVEVILTANPNISMANLGWAMAIAFGGFRQVITEPGASAQPWLGTPIYWLEVKSGEHGAKAEAILSVVRKEQTNLGDPQTREEGIHGTPTSDGEGPSSTAEGILTLLDQHVHRGSLAHLREMEEASPSRTGAATNSEGPSLSMQATQGSLRWCRLWYCFRPDQE